MITKQDAIRIAEHYLNYGRRSGPYTGEEARLVDDEATLERPYGWLFIYNTPEYIRTRNLRTGLIGNGPMLVLREDGSIIKFASSYDREEALAEYEANPEKFQKVVPGSH